MTAVCKYIRVFPKSRPFQQHKPNTISRTPAALHPINPPVSTLHTFNLIHTRSSHTPSRPASLVDGGPMSSPRAAKANPMAPRPSSSVLLVSPTNQILLLHRVQTSSAFPSAHVFPGGNLDAKHDGMIPGPEDPARHVDGPAYRLGAIRECFEESGILLARNNGFGRLLEVGEEEREKGRREVHEGKIDFRKWLAGKGGWADVDGLIPFTRWITPTNVPKRFTTQMYIYFLPLDSTMGSLATGSETLIPTPTHDGGIEHTAARFLPPSVWISMAHSGEVILFPPQLFLLHIIAPFLSAKSAEEIPSAQELRTQRQELKEFLKTGDPPWADKCISPTQVLKLKGDGRFLLGLDKPGPELKGSGRRGEYDRVVLVEFRKEGPRKVDVRWRKDIMDLQRAEEKL